MTWKHVFTSSIGKKLVRALTGISLILFLVVHVGLNACIWANDGGEMFNRAANFMGSNVVPRILEVGLFAGIFLHIIQGYMLTVQNRSKRSVGYEVSYGNKGSKWYSRSMGILGTLLLLFFIMHWKQFWIPSRFTGIEEVTLSNGKMVHNTYALMRDTFQDLWVVILYVIGCISLGYHLAHGFQSSFRTVGVHNNRYNKMLTGIGYGFAIIVPLAFAMMPVSFYLGWIR
jgi:succinate dehydrogenase / fumarate reductase cytochrome b subunit